jgi:hypothetical protein
MTCLCRHLLDVSLESVSHLTFEALFPLRFTRVLSWSFLGSSLQVVWIMIMPFLDDLHFLVSMSSEANCVAVPMGVRRHLHAI